MLEDLAAYVEDSFGERRLARTEMAHSLSTVKHQPTAAEEMEILVHTAVLEERGTQPMLPHGWRVGTTIELDQRSC